MRREKEIPDLDLEELHNELEVQINYSRALKSAVFGLGGVQILNILCDVTSNPNPIWYKHIPLTLGVTTVCLIAAKQNIKVTENINQVRKQIKKLENP